MIKMNMSEAIYTYEQGAGHFFDRDTMRFFNSKIVSTLYKNRCFITSEKTGFTSNKIRYTVRQFSTDFLSVDTVSDFLQFSTIEGARDFARNY